MEKVRPWCGQPSDRGRLKNRTEQGFRVGAKPHQSRPRPETKPVDRQTDGQTDRGLCSLRVLQVRATCRSTSSAASCGRRSATTRRSARCATCSASSTKRSAAKSTPTNYGPPLACTFSTRVLPTLEYPHNRRRSR